VQRTKYDFPESRLALHRRVKDVLVLCFPAPVFRRALRGAEHGARRDAPLSTHQGALLVRAGRQRWWSSPRKPLTPSPPCSASEAPVQQYRLRDVVGAVDASRAPMQQGIKAVVLDLDGFVGGGQVALTRLGKALDGVRARVEEAGAGLCHALQRTTAICSPSHGSEVWLQSPGRGGALRTQAGRCPISRD
jgi:protease-4